jgi:hypothetical protein
LEEKTMAWKPLGLFKSEKSSSTSVDTSRTNTIIQSTENTVRSLFVNTSIEKAFNEKVSVSIKKTIDIKNK